MDAAYFDLIVNLKKTTNQKFDLVVNRNYQTALYCDFVTRRPRAMVGAQSVKIGIVESTLSNTYNIDSATDYGINDIIKGKVLDLDYSFKVATKSKTLGKLIKAYTGRYDNDALLYRYYTINYTPRRYSYKDQNGKNHIVRYAMASDIAKALANAVGLKLNYNAIDFIPSQTVHHVDNNDTSEAAAFSGTYQSILSSLFGWLGSRLPNLMINVYIEGDTLHVLQRGAENGASVKLDSLQILEGATLKSQQIRTQWGGVGSNMPQSLGYDDGDQVPFTGVIEFGKSKAVYNNGYLYQETNNETTTYYEYGTVDESSDLYLVKRLTIEIEENAEDTDTGVQVETYGRVSKVEYQYTKTNNDIYQNASTETTGGEYTRAISLIGGYNADEVTKMNDGGRAIASTIASIERYTDWSDASTTITRLTPVGGGWYGQSVYSVEEEAGTTYEELQSSNLTQGAPGQKASQYMVDKSSLSLDNSKMLADNLAVLIRLLFHGYVFFDNSFPIAIVNNRLGLDTAVALTNAINNLNLKTEETLICTVINYNHAIRINDIITYNGNQYRLQSNNISQDPTGIKQELTLVRWYDE